MIVGGDGTSVYGEGCFVTIIMHECMVLQSACMKSMVQL